MTYFCAELVQLIVSRSDSELEVQRYGMKKNTVTVDPIMLQDELWMKQWKNCPQTAEVGFLKTEPRKPSFHFLNFEVGLVRFLENRYPKFSLDSTPLLCLTCLLWSVNCSHIATRPDCAHSLVYIYIEWLSKGWWCTYVWSWFIEGKFQQNCGWVTHTRCCETRRDCSRSPNYQWATV